MPHPLRGSMTLILWGMFLNYPLDEAVRLDAGVDVSNVNLDELTLKHVKRIIECWV